jgi:arginyl-tRNA synthetase
MSSVNYVHKMLLVSKYTAIKQLVSSHLVIAVSTYTSYIKIPIAPENEISLYRSREEGKVLYISSVALKLAKAHRMDACAVAHQIASHFPCNSYENFRVEIIKNGSIHIQVAPGAISACLQSLVEGVGSGSWGLGEEYASSSTPYSLLPTPYSLLPQYTHARCCSLLRLVEREGLMPIVLAQEWLQVQQLEIPWLDSNQKLRFHHPASYRLIAGLVAVVDDLVCSDIPNLIHWQKLALNLSRAFESFWCNCRIFGEEKTVYPELVSARIGLVIATRTALKLLLEEKLGIRAIDEL